MQLSLKAVLLIVAAVVICFVAGAAGGAMTRHFGTSSYTLSYADFISVLLTAVSLLMTLLAFAIALFAYIGWNAISTKVQSRTESFLSDGFKEGNHLHRMLRRRSEDAMYDGVTPIDPKSDAGNED